MVANNEKALSELIGLAKDHQNGAIDTADYLKESEKVIFNKVSGYGVSNFNDGLKNGGYINIIIHVNKAINGDAKAYLRLLIDLEIEEANLTIKAI